MIGKNVFNYGQVQTISGSIDEIAYNYFFYLKLKKSGKQMAKTIFQCGESGGERKIQPRAGPVDTSLKLSAIKIMNKEVI